MVTVFGTVEPGTPFDPTKIADAFWALYARRDASLGVEIPIQRSPGGLSDAPLSSSNLMGLVES
jgi:hypothetical protein